MFFHKIYRLLTSHRDLHLRVERLEHQLWEEHRARLTQEQAFVEHVEKRLAQYDRDRDTAAHERMGLLDGTQADVERLRLETAQRQAEDRGIPAELRSVGGEDRLVVGHPVDVAAVTGAAVNRVDDVLTRRIRLGGGPLVGGMRNG